MQDTKAPTPKPEALSRTWRVTTEYRCYGENWGNTTNTVTLTRDHVGGPLTAEVDGQPADLERAVKLLHYAAQTEVLDEVLSQPTPPTIGKVRAHKLHKLLGRVPCDHYGIAGRALGREVRSLAALTEQEARKVWNFVRFMFPDFFPTRAA